MPRRSTLRASDADREQIADRLREAAAEGRLVAEELEERLGRLFSSRTYGELDGLVDDLPRPVPARRPRTARQLVARGVVALAVIGLAMIALSAIIAAVFAGIAGLWLFWPFLALAFFMRRGGGFGRHYSYGRRRRVTAGRWF
jgi:hypothetical protein